MTGLVFGCLDLYFRCLDLYFRCEGFYFGRGYAVLSYSFVDSNLLGILVDDSLNMRLAYRVLTTI